MIEFFKERFDAGHQRYYLWCLSAILIPTAVQKLNHPKIVLFVSFFIVAIQLFRIGRHPVFPAKPPYVTVFLLFFTCILQLHPVGQLIGDLLFFLALGQLFVIIFISTFLGSINEPGRYKALAKIIGYKI